MAKEIAAEEQALRDTLSKNIRKYRKRRNWSQFVLAANIDISTNFLADIEAGNTWVSSGTLVKLAKAFDIEAFELLKPESAAFPLAGGPGAETAALLARFSRDLALVLQESVQKAVDHVKNQYSPSDHI